MIKLSLVTKWEFNCWRHNRRML